MDNLLEGKILFIGPLYNGDITKLGGTTVSFEAMLNYYNIDENWVITTNRFKKPTFDIINAIYVIGMALIKIPRSKIVILNVSSTGIINLASVILCISILFRRKFVLRLFGGDLYEFYTRQTILRRTVIKAILKSSDLVCLQTQRLIKLFDFMQINSYWLPTARKMESEPEFRKTYNKRFIYLGQIIENKGIDLLLRLAKELDSSFILHLYGPILDDKYSFLKGNSIYKGIVEPNQVNQLLKEYDVMLFPSIHPGEGLPGVLIEACQAGMPIIASNWLAIPELVIHGYNGFLFEPLDFDSMLEIIYSIDESRLQLMSKNAMVMGLNFNIPNLYNSFEKQLMKL